MFQKIFLFFAFAIPFFACQAPKKVGTTANLNCSTLATVQDFSKTKNGCGLLLVTSNGEKFLPLAPLSADTSFHLRAGQKVRFGFQPIKGVRTTCGVETSQVRITCIEEILEKKSTPDKSTPLKKECVKTDRAIEVDWMDNLIQKIKPRQIQRFAYRTDGWAYIFKTDKMILMYDCQGNLVCTGAECVKQVEKVDAGEVVYQK